MTELRMTLRQMCLSLSSEPFRFLTTEVNSDLRDAGVQTVKVKINNVNWVRGHSASHF